MKTLEKVSDFVGKYMAAIVIVVAALSLLFPGTFSVVKTAWVNTLLGIVMFGMGLTLKPEDFKVVFSRPKDVIIGCIAQFTLMPFLAWALTQLFHLPTELAIGVILVGTCPGGTSSTDVHDHPVRQGDHQNKQNEREPTAQRALDVAQLTDMGHMVSL